MATKMANSEEAVKRITESEEHFICTTYSYILVMSHHSAYAGFSSHANWNIGLCLGQTTSNSRNEPYLQFETQSLWGFWNSKPPKKIQSTQVTFQKNFPSSFKKPPRPCTWSGRLASLGTMEWWCYSSNFCKFRFVYSTCSMHDRAKNRFVVLFFRHGGMDGGRQVGKVGKLVVWVRDGW